MLYSTVCDLLSCKMKSMARSKLLHHKMWLFCTIFASFLRHRLVSAETIKVASIVVESFIETKWANFIVLRLKYRSAWSELNYNGSLSLLMPFIKSWTVSKLRKYVSIIFIMCMADFRKVIYLMICLSALCTRLQL